MYGYPAPPPQQKSGLPTILVVVLVVVALFVVGGGILAVLAIFGVRSYVDASKSAEATSTLGQIQKRAAITYELEQLGPGALLTPDSPNKVEHALCASASSPVPKSLSDVAAKKYMSSASEWLTDRESNAGFACLKFEMTSPQYYQYDYKATADTFTATARGDLDGDGEPSTFEITGKVDKATDTVRAQPLTSKNPKE